MSNSLRDAPPPCLSLFAYQFNGVIAQQICRLGCSGAPCWHPGGLLSRHLETLGELCDHFVYHWWRNQISIDLPSESGTYLGHHYGTLYVPNR